MTLDLRSVTISNPFDPSEPPASAAFQLSRFIALAPELSMPNPAEAMSVAIRLLEQGVADFSPDLAIRVESALHNTGLLNNLVKDVLLREWNEQKWRPTDAAE